MKSKTNPTSKNTSDLGQIERVKLDLLSLVSHELRTPLTGVLNSLLVLREGNLDDADRRKFLDMAHRNAERLNSALNQLLDLSKLVSGRLVCRFHEVSLRALLVAQCESLETEAKRQGLKLKAVGLSKALEALPVILGDAPRLEQVVKSLFENALKFAPSGSALGVHLQPSVAGRDLPKTFISDQKMAAEYVVFEVSNALKEGAKVNQKNLFKIFGQQESVLNRAHEGVGGSLAIAAEVVRQHGGGMQAEIHNGSFTIRLVLPVLKSEQALLKVLESRMYALRTELGAISLVLLEVNGRSLKRIFEVVKAALFRASDAAYILPDDAQIAVLMDDCKKSDVLKIVDRLLGNLGSESSKLLIGSRVGMASFPEDATEALELLKQARASFAALRKL